MLRPLTFGKKRNLYGKGEFTYTLLRINLSRANIIKNCFLDVNILVEVIVFIYF